MSGGGELPPLGSLDIPFPSPALLAAGISLVTRFAESCSFLDVIPFHHVKCVAVLEDELHRLKASSVAASRPSTGIRILTFRVAGLPAAHG